MNSTAADAIAIFAQEKRIGTLGNQLGGQAHETYKGNQLHS